MLQNESKTEQPTPTGQNRVTPDELNRALAALEARKQAEAQRLAGTIPIEEAVSQLHLDATPDEIWAEVQSQRNRTSADEGRTFAEADAARRAQLAQAHLAQAPTRTNQSVRPRGRWKGIRVVAPLLFLWFLVHSGMIPHFGGHGTHAASPTLQSLAQVPSGVEVYADDASLTQVSEGQPLAQITISKNEEGNRWRLVKLGGHVYLRGYIASTTSTSLPLLQGHALNVYNDDNRGDLEHVATSAVTLRVDNVTVRKSGGDDEYSELTVPNFQPDSLTTLSPWH